MAPGEQDFWVQRSGHHVSLSEVRSMEREAQDWAVSLALLGSCLPLTLVESGVWRSTGLLSGPQAAEPWRKLVVVNHMETGRPKGAVIAQTPEPCDTELWAIQRDVAGAHGHTAHQQLGTLRPPEHEVEWPCSHADEGGGPRSPTCGSELSLSCTHSLMGVP